MTPPRKIKKRTIASHGVGIIKEEIIQIVMAWIRIMPINEIGWWMNIVRDDIINLSNIKVISIQKVV